MVYGLDKARYVFGITLSVAKKMIILCIEYRINNILLIQYE